MLTHPLAKVLLVILLGAAADPSSPDVVLARMSQAQSNLTTLVAGLTQVKSYPQLGIEDPAERGYFYLEHSKSGETKVKMEIREPETRILRVRDGEYLLYQPRIKQAVEGKLRSGGKKSMFSGILTGSPAALAELENDYHAESLGLVQLGERSVTQLRFVAKPDAGVYCQQIDLWIDTTLWLPVQQSCHEANQSVITFALEDVRLNVPLAKGAFEVEIPSDVERLRN